MAPRLDFSEWWAKEERKGTPLVVTMENPNYSLLEIQCPDSEEFHSVGKAKGKNAKQFTWVLLLRAHRAVGCLAWLLSAIKKRMLIRHRIIHVESDNVEKGRVLFKFIRAFLVISFAVLMFEIMAHSNGWHFQRPNLHLPQSIEIKGWLHSLYLSWLSFRAHYIAYPIQLLSSFCVVLFAAQSLDRLVLCFGCLWIKLKKIKPEIIDSDSLKCVDVEEGSNCEFPMVLVQIPMCNEREVKLSSYLVFQFYSEFP